MLASHPRFALLKALVLAVATSTLVKGQNVTDFDWTTINPSTALNWTSCYTSPLQCTRLIVPLNYTNPDSGTVALALIRLPSPLGPDSPSYRGPVLYNPGGPGNSGVQAVLQGGERFQGIIGEEFDFLSFDPRGVSFSTPSILWTNSSSEFGIPIGVDLFEIDNATSSTWPARYEEIQKIGEAAKERNGEFIKHVTTDNVARDMLSIVQAYGREKIQYWGISYGTVLGTTFATMFPDKIERFILDGVVDVEGYYSADWRNEVLDTDASLSVFLTTCSLAGPTACPFYAPTPQEIGQRIDALLASFTTDPITLKDNTTLTPAEVKGVMVGSLYNPAGSYAGLAKTLKGIEDRDPDVIAGLGFGGETGVDRSIECTDAVPVGDSKDALMGYADLVRESTKCFEILAVGVRAFCSGWKVHPDHFRGPFGSNTSHPILFIGNTEDPATPLVLAHKASANFPGSTVLTFNFSGHSSTFGNSQCMNQHVRTYFLNGTLPEEGARCDDNVVDYFGWEWDGGELRGI